MNGIAENKHQALQFQARTMLIQANLSTASWAEAVNTMHYVLNRLPSIAIGGKIPYTLWTGRLPTLAYLRVFGALAYAYIHDSNRKKFDPRGEKLVLVGYMEDMKAYKLLNPATHTTKYSRSVLVDESFIFKQEWASSDQLEGFLPATFVEGSEQEGVQQQQHVMLDEADDVVAGTEIIDTTVEMTQNPATQNLVASTEVQFAGTPQRDDTTGDHHESVPEQSNETSLIDFSVIDHNTENMSSLATLEDDKDDSGSRTPQQRSSRTHRLGRDNWIQKPYSPPDFCENKQLSSSGESGAPSST